MDFISSSGINFGSYWSGTELVANFLIILHLAGSLALGCLVGYERSYRGRAAGMRTFGLVCMASCAMTVFAAFPTLWFGGNINSYIAPIDPTRAIQGVLTGIGFLGAGMIMKEGLSISGLSTAASIWTCSAIGILIGLGFYAAGIMLAILTAMSMSITGYVENFLPKKEALQVQLRFAEAFEPNEAALFQAAVNRGYSIAQNSLQCYYKNGAHEWHYIAVSKSRSKALTVAQLSDELSKYPGVKEFSIVPTRN